MSSQKQYTALAAAYDRLNASVDYDAWADYLDRTVKKYGAGQENLWLDLACGTGTITTLLAKRGHMMIGADLSADMLQIAREKGVTAGMDILWLLQDMRSFELYGTVDAVCCCLDSINYLPNSEGLRECFSLVNNYLGPGGVFLFDVNTPKKFREIYGSNDYILEAEDVYCGWHNCFHEKSGVCTFDLSVFSFDPRKNAYIRHDEQQKEYCYSRRTLENALKSAGLEICGVFSDFQETPATDDDERWFFVCRGTGKDSAQLSVQ